MSGQEYDAFGDIINTQNGIFAADQAQIEPGLTKFDQASTVAQPDGVKVVKYCAPVAQAGQGCGRTQQLTIEYAELIAIKYGVSPHLAFSNAPQFMHDPCEWRYNPREQGWHPMVTCPNCATLLLVFITQDEAERHLAVARRHGWIHPQAEAAASRRADQVARHVRGQQAR